MERVVAAVVALYEENEKRLYSDAPATGEEQARGYEDLEMCIGFVDHALQAAKQAAEAHADEETVAAALLHDIGWLIHKPTDSALLTTSDDAVWLSKHDVIGGQYLRQLGFSDRLSRLVEGHVQAKRYLTYKVDGYYEGLSAGSKFTLKHQGGPMTVEEAAAFEADPDFVTFCQMRRWDEGAKIKDLVVPELRSYSDAIGRCLQQALWLDRRGFSAATVVTEALRQQLQSQGYVVLRRFLTDAEVSLLPAYCSFVSSLPLHTSPPGPFHTYERTADGKVVHSRTECFCDAEDPYRIGGFLKSGRLQQACQALRGGRPQSLLKEKINYKMAGGGGYLAHQDSYWFVERGDGETMRAVRRLRDEEVCVCMLAVDHADASNGCPEVAPGWHSKGWLGLNAPAEEQPAAPVDPAALPWLAVELQPGDVLIYGNHMPHKSGVNTSERDRRAMFAIYGDVETVGADMRERYYLHEKAHRRANGTASTAGKANRYFGGDAVHIPTGQP